MSSGIDLVRKKEYLAWQFWSKLEDQMALESFGLKFEKSKPRLYELNEGKDDKK